MTDFALKFDGSTSYARAADSVSLSPTGSVTVEAWDGSARDTITSVATVSSLNTWHHVSGSFDGTTFRVSINGVVESKNSEMNPRDGNTNLQIGRSGAQTDYFKGKIDEVRISNVARYTANFTAVRSHATDTSTLALWKMNENTGTTTADASANANTGTLTGTTLPVWVSGVVTNAKRAERSTDGESGRDISRPGSAEDEAASDDWSNRYEKDATASAATQAWEQVFTYDRYGNRLSPGPSIDPLTNKINGTGYIIDLAGNMTREPVGASYRTYTYNAENRMTQAVAGGVTTNYVYDAEGRRVKKTSGTTVTRYVYGISGELVAEYTGSTPVQSKEYVSGPTGLLLVVDTPGASQTLRYVTPDNLGTPRLHTSAGPTPSVLGRFDYMPFGEEIFGTSTPQSFNAGRTTAMGYTASDTTASQKVRQKFTSKERDAETGLDYFGARYFSRSQGRFTSADPILIKKARLMDPQRINLYAYARNSPLEYIDPNGADIMLAKDLTPEDKSYAVKHLARLYSTSKGKAYLERADKSQFDVLITVGKLPRTTEGDKTHITGGITAYGVRTDLETGQRSLNAGGPPYLENVAPITVTIDPNNVKAMGMDPAKTFAHEIGGHTANVLNLAERVDPASGQMGLDISPLDKKQDEDSSQDAEDIGDLPKDPSPEAMKAVETLLMPREEPRPE